MVKRKSVSLLFCHTTYIGCSVCVSMYVQSYVPTLEKCEDSTCRFNETA